MTTAGSVTLWLQELKNGNDYAAQQLWNLYFERLVRLARKKMGGAVRRVRDEEDIALSAFKSLCKGVKRPGNSEDMDRDHLWKLMATITLRKIYDHFKFNGRQKRCPIANGDGQIFSSEASRCMDEIISREPGPELNAQLDEQLSSLLAALVHEDLKKIAVLKIEGHTNREIASQLDRGISTIERKLQAIRKIWQHELN